MKNSLPPALLIGFLLLSKGSALSQSTRAYTVPDGTRIQAKLETTLSSKTNRQGDRFTAKVTEPVIAGGESRDPFEHHHRGADFSSQNCRQGQRKIGNESFL